MELVTSAERPPATSKAPLPAVPKLKRSQTSTGIIAIDGGAPRREPRPGAAALGRVGTLPRRLDVAAPRDRLGRQSLPLGLKSEKRKLSATRLDETHEDRPHDADDGATHYFSIETRLELKERLVAVQKQLDGVIVRAKLAWMKCFVVPADSSAQSSTQSSMKAANVELHDPMKWAAELVDCVESLASDLTTAFSYISASDGSNSLDEYKALVECAEKKLAGLLTLANRIAAADPSHFCRQDIDTYQSIKNEQTVSVSPLKEPPAQVSFDLPSMKTYSAKVAPPYTAYLPVKERLRRR